MPDFNPEELLSVDWEKVSNGIEDLEMSRMRTAGYFSDVENFSIIIDIRFIKNNDEGIGENWITIISTDGQPDDPEWVQEQVQDYIRENYWDNALKEAITANKINYDAFEEWYEECRYAPPKYKFEIKEWVD